ncbi:MAG: hypothetical protein ACXITV_08580 [Luteibaculaceae bacterium]
MENYDNTLENVKQSDEIRPKIYSRKAVLGFSIFFSTIFGAVLLMQNLKDIGKKREAYYILFLSFVYTAFTIYFLNMQDEPKSSLTYLMNMIGGAILSEYFFKKHIPADHEFEKKKIWKPLTISIIITIPFLLAIIYG